jgi:hypothetical protein
VTQLPMRPSRRGPTLCNGHARQVISSEDPLERRDNERVRDSPADGGVLVRKGGALVSDGSG